MGRFDHGKASKVHPYRTTWKQQQHHQSFLWTIVRDPTARAVSEFFHFAVSIHNATPTLKDFQSYFHKTQHVEYYYLTELHTNISRIQALRRHKRADKLLRNQQPQQQQYWFESNSNVLSDRIAADIVHSIVWEEYDFIGVTERMEETAVAFNMLLNGTLADILHLPIVKGHGSYDDMCRFVPSPVLTPDMQAFLHSPSWQRAIYWDRVLYQLANASLDATIARLGTQAFGQRLQQFRAVQTVVRRECGHRNVFPCTSDGHPNHKHKDCLWIDSGCGYHCIQEVVDKLGLD